MSVSSVACQQSTRLVRRSIGTIFGSSARSARSAAVLRAGSHSQHPLLRTTAAATFPSSAVGNRACDQTYRSRKDRFFSSGGSASAAVGEEEEETTDDTQGPTGSLFVDDDPKDEELGGPSLMLIGKTASIRRTFGPRDNSEAILICGGSDLAAHASFDPEYHRAQEWIRHHAVGPAVLSPVLISGLTQALVEAAFPESVPDSHSMRQLQPLIVGVEINATIEVVDVVDNNNHNCDGDGEEGKKRQQEKRAEEQSDGGGPPSAGYKINLRTTVTRVRDSLLIAEGSHSVWIPNYLRM